MEKVIIVGMGISSRDLTKAHLEIIHSADLLMGGRRHLEQFQDLPVKKQMITGKITEAIETIRTRKATQRIVVLASGDPLLFGVGALICRQIGEEHVRVLPNVSSIAGAFARINAPWGDAKIISLHGRDHKYRLLDVLKSYDWIAVLTDPTQTPNWLAGWLLERGVEHVGMAVFEQMGVPQEKFGWYSLEQAAAQTFSQPNLAILKRWPISTFNREEIHFGMADETFTHKRGLITKAEVRAVTLAKLSLKPGVILWDLGAGSGSVGLEAASLLGEGSIYAVEEKAERVLMIKENQRRLGVYNHIVVQAKLPEGLEMLPPPDRVFIGGGGRDLVAITACSCQKMKPHGVIVVNTVLVDNLISVTKALEAAGMTIEVVQVQISRSKEMPYSWRFEAENPVWVIRGKR